MAPQMTEEDEFASAFGEGEAPAEMPQDDMTEEAGIDLADAVEDQGEATETPEADAAESDPGEAMAAEPAEPVEVPAEATADAGPVDMEKEIQRLKSWEGRLKAREAELKARAEPAAADAGVADAVAEVAAAVEQGKSPDDALAVLAQDFGPDFVSAIERLVEAKASTIAEKVATEKMGVVSGTVDQLIGELTDERQRSHFETIADQHPDFMDVAKDPAFTSWVEGQGEQAQGVIANGSAKQVVALLSAYKSQAGGQDDEAMQAAEAVPARRGLQLPKQPAASDDFESAWNSF